MDAEEQEDEKRATPTPGTSSPAPNRSHPPSSTSSPSPATADQQKPATSGRRDQRRCPAETPGGKVDENIRDYAETTMNELLAWYGLDKVDSSSSGDLNSAPGGKQSPATLTSKALQLKLLKENSEKESDNTQKKSLHPQVGSSTSEVLPPPSTQTNGLVSSASSISEHSENSDKDEVSVRIEAGPVHPSDGLGSYIVCGWCGKPGVKLYSLKAPNSPARTFCSEQCFTQCRRATFKKSKVCDWCKHVRHTVNYVNFSDGDQQLQFCSEKCLNQYKMNIFCKETSEHMSSVSLPTPLAPRTPLTDNEAAPSESGEDDRIIITPELWMDRDNSRNSNQSQPAGETPLDLKTSLLPPPPNPPSVEPIEVKPRSIREELRMVGSIKKEVGSSSSGSSGRRGTATNHRPPRMTDREKIRQIRLRDQISVSLANPISVRSNTSGSLLSTACSGASSDKSQSPPPALSASAAAAVAATQAAASQAQGFFNVANAAHQQSLLYHHLLPSSLLSANGQLPPFSSSLQIPSPIPESPRSNITEQRRRASRETSATPTPRAASTAASLMGQATPNLPPPPAPPSAAASATAAANAAAAAAASIPGFPAGFPPYMAAALGAGLFPPQYPPHIPGLFPPPPAGMLPPTTLLIPWPLPIPIPMPIPIPIPIPMRYKDKADDKKGSKVTETSSSSPPGSVVDPAESEESSHTNCACCNNNPEEMLNTPPVQVINIRPNSATSPSAETIAAYMNHTRDIIAAQPPPPPPPPRSGGSDVENEAMDLSTGGGSVTSDLPRSRTLSPHMLSSVDQNKNHTSGGGGGSKSVSPGVSSTTSETEHAPQTPSSIAAAAATSYMLSSMMQDAAAAAGCAPGNSSTAARYQARRSLILDAPTIPKQKHRSPSPSNRDYYSKRRCIRARLKTK